MRIMAAILVVLGLALAAGTGHVLAAGSETGPRGADACAKGKAEYWASHREAFAPDGGGSAIAATPGQENYDVKYYDLNVMFQTTGLPRKVFGTVIMRAKVLSATLTQVPLDLKAGMTITGVTAGGVATTYTRSGNVITVALNRTYLLNEIFEVSVTYNGAPTGAVTFETYEGAMLIYSQVEPYNSRNWWPCKDWSEDKADSMDIHLNVPDTHVAASNGTLLSVTVPSAGRKQYNWKERYPIATYLVSVAAYPYTVYSEWWHYSPTDSMEVRHHVFPSDYPACVPSFSLTIPMLDAFSDRFGQYPFIQEKYGHAAYTWGGAMEHQTCTSITGYDEYIIAHELGHQWLGDMVTCDTFHHIWFQEGGATFMEAVWAEAQYGQAAYHAQMAGAAYFGPGTVYVENPLTDPVFDSGLSYYKASWVYHMLRHVIGETAFWNGIQTIYASPGTAYATITTDEFKNIFEAAAGRDLDRFFQQWIYGEYYPIYDYDWQAAPAGPASGYNLALTIDQTQTWQLFEMPIDVTVTFAGGGDTTIVVQDSLAHQVFNLNVAQQPVRVQLDKDNWILRLINEPLPTPTFDRGLLVVNGVDWATYDTEIRAAYNNNDFWGTHSFEFWDCFATPAGGYPATLPVPLGHGTLHPDTLKQFSAVVWVGNNFNGDASNWNNTPIKSYLEAGGNVLLLSRLGQDFVTPPLQQYLGINWTSGSVTLSNCTTQYPGIVSIPFIGSGQSLCAAFDTTFTQPETELLFRDTSSGVRGTGAWRKPAGGGQYRPEGGQFAFVSGRPYRMAHNELRANVQFILDNLFGEPYNPASAVESGTVVSWSLGDARPNPFNPKTTIRFNVARDADMSLRVFDVAGRLVTTLVNGPVTAGAHSVTWDGRGADGRRAASGVYFYRLEAPGYSETRKMVMMK